MKPTFLIFLIILIFIFVLGFCSTEASVDFVSNEQSEILSHKKESLLNFKASEDRLDDNTEIPLDNNELHQILNKRKAEKEKQTQKVEEEDSSVYDDEE